MTDMFPQAGPNHDRIQLLVNELRSGNRAQTTGNLATVVNGKDAFCCLGVACEVAIANGLDALRIERLGTGPHAYEWEEGAEGSEYMVDEGAMLPRPAIEWYGFVDDNPELKMPNGDLRRATELNDELGWNFAQIATAFEVTFLDGEYPADVMDWPYMTEGE